MPNDKYGIIEPGEILFVDDSRKHIFGIPGHVADEGALAAGWNGVVVRSNLSATELRDIVISKIREINSDHRYECDFVPAMP